MFCVHYFDPWPITHFSDERIKAQRGLATCPASTGKSRDSNSDLVSPRIRTMNSTRRHVFGDHMCWDSLFTQFRWTYPLATGDFGHVVTSGIHCENGVMLGHDQNCPWCKTARAMNRWSQKLSIWSDKQLWWHTRKVVRFWGEIDLMGSNSSDRLNSFERTVQAFPS